VEGGSEGEAAESGSLRIEAGNTLDKLQDYQLKVPEHFLRHWVRLAVLSGAKNVGVHRRRNKVSIRFEGRPLPEQALKDPFSALLGGLGEDQERCRSLIIGLLGVLRLAPKQVSIATGHGAERMEAVIRAADLVWSKGLKDSRAETRIDVEWEGLFSLAPGRPEFEALRAACGLLPITFNKKELDPPRPVWASVWDPLLPGEFRGVFSVASGDAGSVLNLYKDGVLVESSREILSRAQCVVHLDCGRFDTDLSCSVIVRDEVYKRAVELIDSSAGDFFQERSAPIPHRTFLHLLPAWESVFLLVSAVLAAGLIFAAKSGVTGKPPFWLILTAMGGLLAVPLAVPGYQRPSKTGQLPRFMTRRGRLLLLYTCLAAEVLLLCMGIAAAFLSRRGVDPVFLAVLLSCYPLLAGVFLRGCISGAFRS